MRYTTRGEGLVLSNFLGRGTDLIEAFLLERRAIGIDINPASIALASKNLNFEVGGKRLGVERPAIVNGDARDLTRSLGKWKDVQFDLVLSHPPYKDCVKYSEAGEISEDLSQIPDAVDFQVQMGKVAAESMRLLKDGGVVLMCMGDNRHKREYIPVAYQTVRTYLDAGFEIEELIMKRQRNCKMSPLGVYLANKYDFLTFTHEVSVLCDNDLGDCRISKV